MAKSPTAQNPLLSKTYLPHKALPFDVIEAAHFEPAILQGIAEHRAEVDAIINNPAAPSFENTIEALEFGGETISRVMSAFGALAGAMKTDEIGAIQQKMQPALIAHSSSISMDEKLFARVKAVYDQRDTLALDAQQALLLENSYNSFAKNGAALPPAQQQRLQEINLALSQLSTTYSDNIRISKNAWEKVITDVAELDGVPASAMARFAAAAKAKNLPEGSYLITLTTAGEVSSYGHNRALREEIYRAGAAVAYDGPHDNRPVILEIVKLRHEKAQLMGHKTFAEMILKDRMAETPETVEDFLAKNLSRYQPAGDADAQAVKDFAATLGMTDMQPWDTGYYGRQLQEKLFNIDLEELRAYFPVEKVVDGMFRHAEKLFNITFTPADGKYPVYDKSMNAYEVYDRADGSLVGVFYTDYYVRPGLKRDGAWMNSFEGACITPDGNKVVPHVINVCNYPAPVGDKPSLLSLREVTTAFHEFGHGLHGLLGRGRYSSMTGTSVKWDFVELPSQLMENWVLEKDVLDDFAAHYQTGQKMPAELIQKVRDFANYGAGSQGQRQTFLAMLDMAFNNADAATITDVDAVETNVRKLTGTFNAASVGAMATSFSHIFSGGYAAGYYSYKWAEVLEADIFENKFKGDLYNRKNADELREKIYGAGSTRPPMELFVDYMGRRPDPEALFRREGLAAPANNNAPEEAKTTRRKRKSGPAPT